MNFILKPKRGDPSHTWNPAPSTTGVPTKEEMAYVMSTEWRWIKPDDIAAFVVLAKFKVTDDKTGHVTIKHHPYTYAVFMIDEFDEMPRFSKANLTYPSDVLADALCRNAKVQEGYGILFYGPRMEFYNYSAGKEWEFLKEDKGDAKDEYQDIEPVMKPIMEAGVHDLTIDMCNSELPVVEEVFKSKIMPRNVIYMGSVVGTKVTESSDALHSAST